jgi:hypothetical protein
LEIEEFELGMERALAYREQAAGAEETARHAAPDTGTTTTVATVTLPPS